MLLRFPARWKRERSYPTALVSLNHVSVRNRLARGDRSGAFALYTDPVMTDASKRLPNFAPWRASLSIQEAGRRWVSNDS